MKNRIIRKLVNIKKWLFHYRKEHCCYIEPENWEYDCSIPSYLSISKGCLSDIAILKEKRPATFRTKKISRFLHRQKYGDQLMIIKVYNDIAGYGWITTKALKIGFGTTMQLKSNEGAIYDAHTFQEYRGKKVYQSFLYAAVTSLIEFGCIRIYSNHDSKNEISRKVFSRMGFKSYSSCRSLRVCGIEFKRVFNNY